MKYGFRDPRGGGRSSGRETIARVVGGALAQLYLKKIGIEIFAYTEAIDGIYAKDFGEISLSSCGERQFFAPNVEVVNHWQKRIEEVRKDLDTLGGVVCIEAHGVPAGLGEPVFQKLDACLSYALMGVGAVKAVEIGDGTAVAASRGSKIMTVCSMMMRETFVMRPIMRAVSRAVFQTDSPLLRGHM